MARLCLNMIVKNEALIIERCLAAAAPHVDCFVICDTGSTDDTIEIVRNFFEKAGIPGVVLSTAFVNFGQARNDALDAARAAELEFDYILFCDADMELVVHHLEFRRGLTGPAYMLVQRSIHGLEYPNIRLVGREVPAKYRGVTHEYLDLGSVEKPVLDGVSYLDHASGANRRGKFERDIALLKQGLEAEPDNARYAFYLGNSYYDLHNNAEAFEWYQRRAAMGGWQEEVFYSNYRIGLCLERLGREAEMIARHLNTFELFPLRAEPLHALALFMQRKSRHHLAYHLAEIGRTIQTPTHGLFLEADVYAWRLEDISAVALYWLGRKEEAAKQNRRLLHIVPASQRVRILENLRFCETADRSAVT